SEGRELSILEFSSRRASISLSSAGSSESTVITIWSAARPASISRKFDWIDSACITTSANGIGLGAAIAGLAVDAGTATLVGSCPRKPMTDSAMVNVVTRRYKRQYRMWELFALWEWSIALVANHNVISRFFDVGHLSR